MKVLLVGPFDTKGRYQGGISYIVNTIFSNRTICQLNGLQLSKFETCRIERETTEQGKFNLENIKNSLYIIHDLKTIAKKNKPHIIYYNSSYGIPLLKDLLAIKFSGCRKYSKVILHIHYADSQKILPANEKMAQIILDLMKKDVDHVVFLSNKTRDDFIKKGISKNKTSVIYNFHNIKMSKEEIKKKSEILKNKKTKELLFIGSIDERKGILDLLDALKKVQTPFHLSICGNPVDKIIEQKMHLAIKELPKDSVDIKGFVCGDTKEKIIKNADILILPSYGEGFPIVLLEGIASACALITTSVGAIPEVFSNKNGIIINPGDVVGLTNAIETLCTDKFLSEIFINNFTLSKEYGLLAFIKKMAITCQKVNK